MFTYSRIGSSSDYPADIVSLVEHLPVEATLSSSVKLNRKVLKNVSSPVDLFFKLKSNDASIQFMDWALKK